MVNHHCSSLSQQMKCDPAGRCLGVQEWQGHPDVLYANYLVKVGQKVTSVEHGMPTWVAELMVRKSTVQESIDFITAIEAGLQVPIT